MVTSQTLQVCTMLELLAFCDDGLWLLVGVFFVFCGADFARRLGETQARLLLCFSACSIRGGNVRFKAFCRVHTRCEATEATNRYGRRDGGRDLRGLAKNATRSYTGYALGPMEFFEIR